MKNMRNIVIGIIIGLILSVPANAAVQEYALKQSEWKVVVDGQAVEDEKYPVLLLPPGYNYVAAGTLRLVCERIGIPLEANSEAKEIRITTKMEVKAMSKSVTPTSAPSVTYTEPTTIERDGVKLVRSGDVKILLEARGYDFIDTGKLNMTSRIVKDDKILVDDIPIKSYSAKGYISYNFYVEHIKPLIAD